MKKRLLGLVAAVVLGATAWASAQGVQTATLSGTVTDQSGLVLPGVTVAVTSPQLQGTREAITDVNGVYTVRGLPAGQYRVAFQLAGFRAVEQQARLEVGGTSVVDARMLVGGLAEQVEVVGDALSSPVATPTTRFTIEAEEVNALPVGRQINDIAELAPGLSGDEVVTPNANQLQIAGAFAYDNVFLVDGVDINDNIFGTPNTLFIEDAIEETAVLTGGISAEYGRFAGGVINAITKSGSNTFSGSFRTSLANDAWTDETPFEESRGTSRPDQINDTYEATFGGPIVEDSLWFFAAGRLESTTDPNPFPQTGLPVTRTVDNKRGEIKFTATAWQSQTFQGSFFNNATEQGRPSFVFSIDPATFVTRSLPNKRWVGNWRGTLGTRVFATAQYSEKRLGFRNSGGTSTDIFDSPFITLTQQLGHYNAPYFDATDPQDRDNRQITGSVSYFVTSRGAGSHDLKVGVESFTSTTTGGNSQSPTGYVFDADYLTDAAGNPAFDGSGRLQPVFVPGATLIENWLPTRGATIDIRTTSLYAQDSWAASPRLTFDLGVRFEDVASDATGDITTVDTRTVMPRLGAAFDVRGDGRLVLQSTYGHYAGKYSEAQFAANTAVANPTILLGIYTGPAGVGRSFAPGFDPANYQTIFGRFPTVNVFVDDGLSSPVTREFTASLASQLARGYLKGTYVWRDTNDIVEDFITLDNGSTTVNQAGLTRSFQNRIFRNSNLPDRKYQALLLQGRHDLRPNWSVNGHWTIQLENEGNFEGEATNQPGISSVIMDFPEARSEARHYPTGRLDDFQRHRVRLWTIYSADVGWLGRPDVSLMYRGESGAAYSLAATNVPVTAAQQALLAAYADRFTSQTLFFEGRGTGQFEAAHLVDFALQYQVPVWRELRPWLKFDVLNLFNRTPLIEHNITVTPDPNSPLDALGLPTGYTRGARFGQGTDNAHYPLPRTYRVAFGVRF